MVRTAYPTWLKAIAIEPKAAYNYNNLGNAHRDLKHYEQAIEQYRKALDIDPKLTMACNNWDLTLQDIKHSEEATKQYDKACKPVP